MTDFNKPTRDDTYEDIFLTIRGNQVALSSMSYAQSTNIPLNAVQFVNGKFQRYNGTTFVDVPVTLTGGGSGATTAAGARSAYDVYSKSETDTKDQAVQDNLDNHLVDSAAHTPSQVGLGNIPNSKSDSYTLNSSTTLATSKAVRDAYTVLNTAISSNDTDIANINSNLSTNYLSKSGNLSGISNTDTARANLGIYVARYNSTGTLQYANSTAISGGSRITTGQYNLDMTSGNKIVLVTPGSTAGISTLQARMATTGNETGTVDIYLRDSNGNPVDEDFSVMVIYT